MINPVRKNAGWWKTLFDKIYLITDARSVCDQKLTCREVDFLEETLKPGKSDRILDLCGGQGRHSLELARRQYKNLTVLDYSQFLINHGKKTARQEGLKVKFYQGDARSTKLKESDYDIIIVMGNSFGYFPNDKENFSILQEINRLLRPGGKVLLDLLDPDYIINIFRPVSWHEAEGGFVICRQRELVNDIIKTREMVLSKKKGLIRDKTYWEKLYSGDKINHILKEIGFKNIKVIKGFSRYDKTGDYGFMSSRMIAMANPVRNQGRMKKPKEASHGIIRNRRISNIPLS